MLRPLLRWTSLLGTAAVLYGLGRARFHHHDFPLFVTILLALALGTVTVFVLTRRAR